MDDKNTEDKNYKNFFNQMNYEMAEEHGLIDNEEMKENKKSGDWKKLRKKNKK